jgi:hypothetical protein
MQGMVHLLQERSNVQDRHCAVEAADNADREVELELGFGLDDELEEGLAHKFGDGTQAESVGNELDEDAEIS